MAFPTRTRLGDIPVRYLLDSFSMIQSLSIILNNSDIVGRKVLDVLGYRETQINYLFHRCKQPVSEALLTWKGTVEDLYRALKRTNQREALLTFYAHLYENINHERHTPRAVTEENWVTILESREYSISPTIPKSQLFMKTYILPSCNRVRDFFFMLFPFNTTYASDMYRAISNLMNNISVVIWCLTIAQNVFTIYSERRLDNFVTISISLSLWIKVYLIKDRFPELKQKIEQCGNDGQELREADFLYKEMRIALLFAFFFKLVLAMIGLILFFAFPRLLLKDLQSQMTQIVMLLFALELIHNAFYLITFYRKANIFLIYNHLFPK